MTGSQPPASTPGNQLQTGRGRRRRRHRLFALGTLGLLLAGQELAFRALFPLPEVTGFNRARYQLLARGDSRSRSIVQRGLVYDRLRFESQPDGFSEVHHLNLYGFRGSDFAIEPPKSGRRILVIGDSVTEGQGAPESGTISNSFARLLARDGDRAEVINLGVVAASLYQLLPLARDSIALLKPTDVILVLTANDLPAPPYPGDFDRPAPAFRRTAELWWVPRVVELFARIAQQEPIYRRWPHASVPFFLPVPDPANPWSRVKDRPPELDPALYQAMTAGRMNPWLMEQSNALPGMLAHDFDRAGGSPSRYLRRVAELCGTAQARLVVAYVPFCGVTSARYEPSLVKLGMAPSVAHGLATDPIYRRQNAMLAAVCRELNLPLADTTAALVHAEGAGTPQYWSYDTHPRPAGYATIARSIHGVWRQAAGPRRGG